MSETAIVYRIIHKDNIINNCKNYENMLFLYDNKLRQCIDSSEFLVVKEVVLASELIQELVH